MEKPYSQACENNKRPILGVLQRHLGRAREVLEIGSGTGQHAVFFAEQLPHLVWQTSDQAHYHAGIQAWLREAGLGNARSPLVLDVTVTPWPVTSADAVFSANTAHIMSWPAVEGMFGGVGRLLDPGGLFLLYGPFSYGGEHTSQSNAAFDASLRARDPAMGVRDSDDVGRLAGETGMRLVEDNDMPANNRLLVFEKT